MQYDYVIINVSVQKVNFWLKLWKYIDGGLKICKHHLPFVNNDGTHCINKIDHCKVIY